MAAAAPGSPPNARAPSLWLFAPAPDLLLGCGLLYALLVVAFALYGSEMRAEQASWLLPLLVLLLGAPHYGATLVRVYDERESRRTYTFFALYATIVVLAFFGISLFSGTAAAWLVTVYLTWSPWHYTGQNYGLAVMFLRRAELDPKPLEKRILYASFLLSYLMVFCSYHGSFGSAPTPESGISSQIQFRALGIPDAVNAVLMPGLLVLYLGTVIASGALLCRRAPLRDLVPTGMLVLTQALWFSVPVVSQQWHIATGVEPLSPKLRSYYILWIGLGHAVQYLWVTTYYARGSAGWRGYSAYLAKVLGAGIAVWTLPAFLLDAKVVGVLPNSTSLALLVAATVNIHHFILDGAIWKLRHMKIASVLIRRETGPTAIPESHGPSWGRRAVWTACAAGVALAVFRFSNEQVLFPRAVERGDYAAAHRAVDRLGYFWQVPDEVHTMLDRQETARRAGRRRPAPAPRPPTY